MLSLEYNSDVMFDEHYSVRNIVLATKLCVRRGVRHALKSRTPLYEIPRNH